MPDGKSKLSSKWMHDLCSLFSITTVCINLLTWTSLQLMNQQLYSFEGPFFWQRDDSNGCPHFLYECGQTKFSQWKCDLTSG